MYEVGHTIKRTFADGDSYTFKIIGIEDIDHYNLRVEWVSVDYITPLSKVELEDFKKDRFVSSLAESYGIPFEDLIVSQAIMWDEIINHLNSKII